MAFELHLTIPENSPAGQVVLRMVASEHLTPEQAVTRILAEAGKGELLPADQVSEIEAVVARVRAQYPTYESMAGSISGPGAHGSREAADHYLAELRDEW